MKDVPPGRTRAVAASALLLLAAATPALAADYTMTRQPSTYEAPPATGATQLFLQAGAGVAVTPPFPIQYFGRSFSTVGVSPYGYLQFGLPATVAGSSHEGFPTTTAALDGVCAVTWSYLRTGATGFALPNDAFAWTSGTGANRKWVVSWENVAFNTLGSRGTFQAQFFETGRIVFAYPATWPANLWAQFEYSIGMDSPGDTRAIALDYAGSSAGFPGQDFVFDPRIDTFTGTLLWDRVVSDESGLGNSVAAGEPLSGVRVELRRDGANLVNFATTAADGTFSMKAIAVSPSSAGALYVVARNAACTVATPTGVVREWTCASSLAFGANVDVGSRTLGAADDADTSLRQAVAVARTIGIVRDWALARTASAIAALSVRLDATTGPGSTYLAAGAGGPLMYVGGPASTNPDAWDAAVLTRTYARHVLAAIAGLPATPRDDRFDAVSDTQNAFAEAFGDELWAEISGSPVAIDGKNTNTAVVRDLEFPTITVTKGPDVAGCMAGALYDLLDPANEPIDPLDGTAQPGRVFQVVDSMTVAPTASTFLAQWVTLGFDATSVTRIFIGNRVLADDSGEPNDDRTQAAALGDVGLRRTKLVLNRANEDWYDVTLPAAAASLVADVTFDRGSLDSVIALEIRTPAGTLLATGAPVGGAGPIHAVTGPVAAGSCRVGVRHVSGSTIPAYGLQVFLPIEMAAAPLRDWTVDRPYDVSLGVAGGVPAYSLTTVGSFLPPGLVFSPLNQHVAGTPTAAGVYPVTVQLLDDGFPSNSASRSQTVVIHDALAIALPAFVAFPLGKPVATTLPATGGTPPFAFAMTSGALPAGLGIDPNSLHVTGTATSAGSAPVAFRGSDVAGSEDEVAARAVVTVPLAGTNVPGELASGDEACGWWFDAVAGSTVSVTVKTAKGRAKRELAGVLLAPDRSAVATGTVRVKSGALSASKLVCPSSGRYHFIVSSAAGEATQLLAGLAVAPPAKGKLALPGFGAADTTTVSIGALPGAKLVLKFAGDKKSGLVAKVVGLLDPSQAGLPFASSVRATPTGGTLTIDLPVGGTWTVRLAATSTSGSPGNLTWSYSLKQPKGGVYSAD